MGSGYGVHIPPVVGSFRSPTGVGRPQDLGPKGTKGAGEAAAKWDTTRAEAVRRVVKEGMVN